jgi:hypothetical protein
VGILQRCATDKDSYNAASNNSALPLAFGAIAARLNMLKLKN